MLIRPTIKKMIPFDSTQIYTFEFEVYGGNQVVKNEIQIMNDDNNLIYTNIIQNLEFKQQIKENTLVNGKNYRIKVRTYDINNNISEWSDIMPFKCLSPTIIKIKNIINGKVHNYTENFQFDCFQNERLDYQNYKWFLYDENESLIDWSAELFDKKSSYPFTGLNNNSNYYIEVQVSTNEMINTSGKVFFKVQYNEPRIPNVLMLENLSQDASVKIMGKITRVLAKSKVKAQYIDNDWIDLTNNILFVDNKEGFKFGNDFTIKMYCKNLIESVNLIKIEYKNGVKIYCQYKYGKIYLTKEFDKFSKYVISKEIVDSKVNNIIWIQSVGNLMNLKIENF